MEGLSPEFWPLVLVGFLAQLIDGALGMAYGVSASAFLATMGHPPAFVSATVHAAEVVTTGASGISHAWFRNLDRKIFFRLVLPGMAGGALGAYLLTSLDGGMLRPLIWGWLFLMGILLLRRAFRRDEPGLARGVPPRYAIGTTNAAEFFVTLAISITFLFTFDWQRYDLVIALLGGGVLAAPLGAWVAKHVPPRYAIIAVGLVVTGLSVHGLIRWAMALG